MTRLRFLVIDAPSTEPSVFLPSKLVESIGARRPVWGISPPGTSADLITEWAGRDDACASPDDVEGVARMLCAGLDSLRNAHGGLDSTAPEQVRQRFSPGGSRPTCADMCQEAIDQVVTPARESTRPTSARILQSCRARHTRTRRAIVEYRACTPFLIGCARVNDDGLTRRPTTRAAARAVRARAESLTRVVQASSDSPLSKAARARRMLRW